MEINKNSNKNSVLNINEYLNKYVNDKGIKQIYISEKTGINGNVISNILNNKRKILASEFLMICEALEIDPNIFRAS